MRGAQQACHTSGLPFSPHLPPPPLLYSIPVCKKAVKEFMQRHGLTYPINDIDGTGALSSPVACNQACNA